MGIHFLLHRPLRWNRKCLEVSEASLRQWRRILSHPLLHHPLRHWKTYVLFRIGSWTVFSEGSSQTLEYVSSWHRSGHWTMCGFNYCGNLLQCCSWILSLLHFCFIHLWSSMVKMQSRLVIFYSHAVKSSIYLIKITIIVIVY